MDYRSAKDWYEGLFQRKAKRIEDASEELSVVVSVEDKSSPFCVKINGGEEKRFNEPSEIDAYLAGILEGVKMTYDSLSGRKDGC